MNERIRKLAEQANLEIDPAHPDHNQQVLEKFAELIIRECAFVAQNKDDTDINFRLARGLAAFKILQHFGVEE